MDFNTFLIEETITEKALDDKIAQFKIIAKEFYATDLVKFVKTFSELDGAKDLMKKHGQIHEDILDFIYELDSAGVFLNKTGNK